MEAKNLKHFWLVVRLLVIALLGGATSAMGADLAFEFDVLPSSEGATFVNCGQGCASEAEVFSVSGGILHQSNHITTPWSWAVYQVYQAFDHSVDMILEWRARIINSETYGAGINLTDSNYRIWAIHLTNSGLLQWDYGYSQIVSMDTTDTFHTYKIVIPAGSTAFDLYVDDTLVYSGVASVYTAGIPGALTWGDVSGPDPVIDWDYVRLTSQDTTPLTITCPPDVTAYTGPEATECGTVVSDSTLGAATTSGGSSPVTITRSGVPADNFFPVGTTTITYTATDAAGDTASGTQTVTVIDNTPPVITVPGDIAATATSSSGAVVTYTVSASDNCSGVAVDSTPASGSTFSLGTTNVTCTATDLAGNLATATFKVMVTYSWSGVLPPINTDGSSVFKLGSTVPVKFQLTGASAGITDAVAKLYYAKVSDGVAGDVNEAVSTAAATTGNLFRYDATSQQYIFNWSTKGLTVGTYQLQIDLGDGVTRTVNVGLK